MEVFEITSAASGKVIVIAPSKDEAEYLFVQRFYPTALDDDLPDLYEVTEVTKPSIYEVDEDTNFPMTIAQWEEKRNA